MSEHKNALLGYVKSKPREDRGDRILGFQTKEAKWQYMKDHDLAATYLIIKEVFGDIGEPVITKLGNTP